MNMTTSSSTTAKSPSATATKSTRLRPLQIFLLAMLCLAIGLGAGVGGAALYAKFSSLNKSPMSGLVSSDKDGNQVVSAEEEDTAAVVERVANSVVSIATSSESISPYYGRTQQAGAGSGIIVRADGYILTNKHVVRDTDQVTVVLADGTTYDNVRVLGTDPLNDIAILKINGASNLPAATFGDSSTTRIGQKVIAIGNSLGQYQNTVTNGIISGKGRPIAASDSQNQSVENLTDLIQTDAAINPGNSGGPLLNTSGQVIGINTAIVEDAQGIGFAIPINATKGVLKSVFAGDGVKKAFLGVNYIDLTPPLAKKENLPVTSGAYVQAQSRSAVQAGGPADKAGLKNGDIITKVGGKSVGKDGSLSSLISEYAPGDRVELALRNGKDTRTATVTLGEYRG